MHSGSATVRLISIAADLLTVLGGGLVLLLVLADLAYEVELLFALLVVAVAVLQMRRAHRRRLSPRYAAIEDRVALEARFGRFHLLAGFALAATPILVSGWIPAVAGLVLTSVLLARNFVIARDTASVEALREVARATAAEDCDLVEKVARGAAAVPIVGHAKCIVRLSRFEVGPNQIGIVPCLFLATCCALVFCYMSLAAAIVYHEAKSRHGKSQSGYNGKGSPPILGLADQKPTYADSCNEIPNPLSIGHRIGELFRHDGQVKAGCGAPAFQVGKTGTWVAAGLCGAERRSVAVAAPDKEAVILYGAPSRLAWQAAKAGSLTGAEAALPSGGDVDLVETVGGTIGFVRARRSATPENKDAARCGEVEGVAEAFVLLPPQMMLLWKDLLEETGEWAWPVAGTESAHPTFAFISPTTEELVATGECIGDSNCSLTVDGRRWPGLGTSYVSLEELAPYLPVEERP